MFHSDKFETSVDNPFEEIDADNEVLDGSLNLTNGCTRVPLKVAKYIYENCNKGLYTEVYEQKSFEDFDEDAQTDAIIEWAEKIEKDASKGKAEEVESKKEQIKMTWGEDIYAKVEKEAITRGIEKIKNAKDEKEISSIRENINKTWGEDVLAKVDNSTDSNRVFAKKGRPKSQKTESK